MNKISTFILFIFSLNYSLAENKYWILFKDKNESGYDYRHYLSKEAIENRVKFDISLHQFTDIPVQSSYLNLIKEKGVKINHTSRWLNAASAYLTDVQAEEISKLSFVKEVTKINEQYVLTSVGIAVNPAYVHIAMKQMQINSFIEDSIVGKNIALGVIDAGFYEAHTDKKLKHLFDENKIKAQRDFLSPERSDIITEKATDADYHGRMVLTMLAGYNSSTRELTGMATGSNYYLARTEDGNREFRGEEDTWIAAMEWMDSLGVRLISTSLGYAIKMDDPLENYTQEQMNGKTTKISQAAQIATNEKGIFLVVSAGNEGGNPSWQIISSPADAEGVLSIGATKSENCERIEYSSIGPAFLPYLKPNVSCYSPNGTSFSAPAIAGFVSCLMQRAPHLNNKQIKEIIEKSAHLYPYGNNFIGYGIPKASVALKLIANPTMKLPYNEPIEVQGKVYQIKSGKHSKIGAVVFHKKNEFVVLEQNSIALKNGKIKVRKISDAVVRTTIVYHDSVTEIIWK